MKTYLTTAATVAVVLLSACARQQPTPQANLANTPPTVTTTLNPQAAAVTPAPTSPVAGQAAPLTSAPAVVATPVPVQPAPAVAAQPVVERRVYRTDESGPVYRAPRYVTQRRSKKKSAAIIGGSAAGGAAIGALAGGGKGAAIGALAGGAGGFIFDRLTHKKTKRVDE